LKEHLSARTRRRLKGTFRAARSPVRQLRRQRKSLVAAAGLADDLRAAGIGPGDVVMAHSALSRIGNVEGGADAVIESLIDAVAPDGTVMMPSYLDAETVFDDYRNGRLTDLRAAPSLTGAITERFRQWPGVERSSHPYSPITAWGAKARYITQGHALDPHTSHRDSPLGRLLELEGKVAGLGASIYVVGLYHVIEDTWEGFPVPVHGATEEITYVDAAGKSVTRPVLLYDPEIRRTRIDQPAGMWIRERFYEHFLRRGILRPFRYGEADSWVVEARPFFGELKRLAEKGITIYTTEEDAASLGPEEW
jgi:aminoglycoside 3-N-acetyltransferase